MQYMGGKFKVARHLAPVIQRHIPDGATYWEPFVGCANIISRIKAARRIGSDLDVHITDYLIALQRGWLPPSEPMTEPQWREWWRAAKDGKRDPMIAVAGYGHSFGANFFQGYARSGGRTVATDKTAYALNSSKRLAPLLEGIDIRQGSYEAVAADVLETRGPLVVYCDPPYEGTEPYSAVRQSFDSARFWDWCRETAKRATVLVSEFKAPPFAREIWSREKQAALRKRDGSRMTERLFMVEP